MTKRRGGYAAESGEGSEVIGARAMTKSYGSNIRCAFPGCGAEPHPSDPNIRETFSLTRLGPDGYPSNDPTIGEWRCEMHPIPRSDPLVKQSTRTTPHQALADFEADFGIEIADLEEHYKTLNFATLELDRA